MARIRLNKRGKNGIIQFLDATTSDFKRFFHQEDIKKLLNDLGTGVKGLTITPVKLKVHEDSGTSVYQGEAFALVANAGDDGAGNPTDLFKNEGEIPDPPDTPAQGDVIILSCKPFEEPGLKYELKIGVIN